MPPNTTREKLLRHSGIRLSALVLLALIVLALGADAIAPVAPQTMDSMYIHRSAGEWATMTLFDGSQVRLRLWMGSDGFGRDIFSRVLHGTRISLLVGLACAALAVCAGALLGLLAGYFRLADALLMRAMDALMAIPAILLAMALVASLGSQLWVLVVAIALPEIPRVTRLVRSLVLALREEPFVEAARALATPTPLILWRHILPNALAPLLVQGTFVAAAAVLTEAALSFLGLGLPPEIPTWGNIMAEGRVSFGQHPGNVLFPALLLVPTVLAINLLGDGLRDVLDPKFSRRGPE